MSNTLDPRKFGFYAEPHDMMHRDEYPITDVRQDRRLVVDEVDPAPLVYLGVEQDGNRAAVVLTADEVRELIDTLTYIMRSNENRKGDGEHA